VLSLGIVIQGLLHVPIELTGLFVGTTLPVSTTSMGILMATVVAGTPQFDC
jgi:hypothetical protein